MAYLIGVLLAAATLAFTKSTGMDRDRALYPLMLIVIASYYALFAVISGRNSVLLQELVMIGLFVSAAWLGFTRWPWLLVAGLAGHGLFDAVHGHLIANTGVPAWWPAFCLAFDGSAAAYVAWRLHAENRLTGTSIPATKMTELQIIPGHVGGAGR
ncbi:hypothetical protein [Novosphingobium ginsenosidimutans]|uniref:hypothetical protein n=1 Tax=Novosphingobium ginsenosidimutans TaxID=1176536 RepID=UPI0018644F1D|nr:hypothetical protein [Novosphingobium ginsenosidimutans]